MDLRGLLRSPNDIIDVSHPSKVPFVNTYTNAFDILLTYDDKFEVAMPTSTVKNSEFEKLFDSYKNFPTVIVKREIRDDIKSCLGFFDMSSYAIFSLVVYDSRSRKADYLVWPSPLGITPENALRLMFNSNLTDKALLVGIYWCNSIVSNSPVSYEIRAVDDTELSLLDGKVEVMICRDGAIVDGVVLSVLG